MKKTPLKRKTPIRRYSRLHPTNASNKRLGAIARRSKTPVAKLKRELWEITRKITFKLHGDTCYTCGAQGLKKANLQAGHFITKSTCSAELAYSLDNIRPQCFSCNIWKSGNWVAFEAHLMLEKGRDFPAELKCRNQETKGLKYDAIWYTNKINEYRAHFETIRGVETKEVMGSK